MKKSIKAALLSGFIIPGSGHLFLKQTKRGYLLLITTIACISIIVTSTVNTALSVLEQLQAEGMVVDINRATELATQAAQNSDSMSNQIAFVVAIFCWIFSIMDAYRIGRKLD